MRRSVTIKSATDRDKLHRWVDAAPVGYRVDFKEPTRSLEQNARMWVLLGIMSKKATIRGQKWSPEQWKAIFMQEMGRQVEVLPTLDGATWFPAGFSSRDLSVAEMSELMALIEAEAAQRGINLEEPA